MEATKYECAPAWTSGFYVLTPVDCYGEAIGTSFNGDLAVDYGEPKESTMTGEPNGYIISQREFDAGRHRFGWVERRADGLWYSALPVPPVPWFSN